VFTPAEDSKASDDLYLSVFSGNDRVDDQVKLTLIANLLDAANTFFEKDQHYSKRIIQATLGSLNVAFKRMLAKPDELPELNILCNLLKKLSFGYHPSQTGSRVMQLD
jgi:hypothetical protein